MGKPSFLAILLPLLIASPGIWGGCTGETWFPFGHRNDRILPSGIAGQCTAFTWIAFALLAHFRIYWPPSRAGHFGYQIGETVVIMGAVGGFLLSLYFMFGQIFAV